MKGLVVSLLLLVVMTYAMFEPCQALTCQDVTTSLAPCANYLTGKGTATQQCCGGVRKLNGLANNTVNRRFACNCMKDNAGRLKGLRYERINQLPGQCGVGLSFTIDLNKCNSIP
ncbi:Non-specific lipid-transfer protein [Rhynchospora pubera]|uniref:Non-specific lipid-transfer protein n=1 Tax=Rhynchospora pubera TaxID=906938 RepID=A0AAV8DRR6_9POAL|nr:Non-specific lipid-transfer protein [Rhynchospora pubera]